MAENVKVCKLTFMFRPIRLVGSALNATMECVREGIGWRTFNVNICTYRVIGNSSGYLSDWQTKPPAQRLLFHLYLCLCPTTNTCFFPHTQILSKKPI